VSRYTFHQSGKDAWSSPRPFTDANMRRQRYGRIQPLEEPGLLQRLLRLA
jgi:hypothetical protein